MWAFMASWFTPTSLFLFINLMIGTIFIISRFGSHKRPPQELHQHQQLARTSSLLERARSINFSLFKFPPPNLYTEAETTTTAEFVQTHEHEYTTRVECTQLERAPSLLERMKSINLFRSDPESETEMPAKPESDAYHDLGHVSIEHQVKRSKSDQRVPEKRAAEKMKKSASEKAVAIQDDEEKEERERVEKRRPATMRSLFVDEEVDAKADDFINKFKQQLKLQRLDSLLRYKRGA